MSVHQLRSHRAKRPAAKPKASKKKVRGKSIGIGHNMGPSFDLLLDDRVLTFREFCQINGIAPRTGRRIIDGPNPPAITRLSERRIGITVRANREWQASRTR
jgi:hypothetical protein